MHREIHCCYMSAQNKLNFPIYNKNFHRYPSQFSANWIHQTIYKSPKHMQFMFVLKPIWKSICNDVWRILIIIDTTHRHSWARRTFLTLLPSAQYECRRIIRSIYYFYNFCLSLWHLRDRTEHLIASAKSVHRPSLRRAVLWPLERFARSSRSRYGWGWAAHVSEEFMLDTLALAASFENQFE